MVSAAFRNLHFMLHGTRSGFARTFHPGYLQQVGARTLQLAGHLPVWFSLTANVFVLLLLSGLFLFILLLAFSSFFLSSSFPLFLSSFLPAWLRSWLPVNMNFLFPWEKYLLILIILLFDANDMIVWCQEHYFDAYSMAWNYSRLTFNVTHQQLCTSKPF